MAECAAQKSFLFTRRKGDLPPDPMVESCEIGSLSEGSLVRHYAKPDGCRGCRANSVGPQCLLRNRTRYWLLRVSRGGIDAFHIHHESFKPAAGCNSMD